MDIRSWNRSAWDKKVAEGIRWAQPVSDDVIAAARQGNWQIILTPQKPVPSAWLEPVAGRKILCLAGAGGQQAPVLAAAGATVTVLDNSPAMLALDRGMSERHQLEITTVEGDMADLGELDDESFDIIVHPASNCFVPDLHPVWREAYRVLKYGGDLLAGFMNPAAYIFDFQLAEEKGQLEVVNQLPYNDAEHLPEDQLRRHRQQGEAMEFSHTLEAQLGGQIAAGFQITGFYEDQFEPEVNDALTRFMPTLMATRARKNGRTNK